jgi:hypothetical protein
VVDLTYASPWEGGGVPATLIIPDGQGPLAGLVLAHGTPPKRKEMYWKERSTRIMSYTDVLKRSWQMVWRYRALWIAGMFLALTTVNGLYFGGYFDWLDDPRGITIQLTDTATIRLPGEGIRVDLRDPQGPTVWVDGEEVGDLSALAREAWDEVYLDLQRDFRSITWPEVPDRVWRDLWAIPITAGVVLLGVLVVGGILRYVGEASLIRMVSEAEDTGEKAGIGRGLRLGFSKAAWRLFAIDLAVVLPVKLALGLLFLLAFAPMLLWFSGSVAAGITGTVFGTGLLFLVIALSIVVSAALSLVMQVIRRASAVDGLGVRASIRRGRATIRANVKEVGIMWLIWIGTRLAWMIASIPVLLLISPIILVFIVAGVVMGAVPAITIGAVLSPFMVDGVPWIIGTLVGLPIFLVVMLLPVLFLGGMVEVYKSSMWTLAYRELRPAESPEPVKVSATGTSGLEAAAVAQ